MSGKFIDTVYDLVVRQLILPLYPLQLMGKGIEEDAS
jgi:hypothetical protein